MLNRRQLIKTGIAATALVAAPSILRASTGGVLKFAPQGDLAVVDPNFTAYITRHHALMVFDQLFGLDENYRPQPQMLEGYATEEGGLLWRFTLRSGMTFHDGEPVRSNDCIASIRRWAAGDAVGATFLNNVDEMIAESDIDFNIRLKTPFPLLPDLFAKLSTPVLVMMPERLAETPPTTRLTEMIGSGPFIFKADERLPGARAVYEKFAGYKPRENGTPSWTAGPKVVHFDRVEWLTMPDPGTAVGAIQTGEIDWWEYAATDLLPIIQNDSSITLEPTSSLGFMASLQLNHLHAPMNNPAFRQVLLRAVKQSDFMEATSGADRSLWFDNIGFFTPGSPAASDVGMELIDKSPEVETLRKELAESGYNGERVVLLGANDLPTINAWGDVANAMLQKIGVNVDYQVMDWGTVLTRRTSREPLENGGWSIYPTAVDGIEQATPLTHRYFRGVGPSLPNCWLTSPDLEKYREEWLNSSSADERRDLNGKLQSQGAKDVVYLPTGQYTQMTALRSNIEGRLQGASLFWNMRRT